MRRAACTGLLLLFVASTSHAHHIMGIPHYAYDERYPQTPILTYVAELGPNEVRMTGYPGIPQPGERCSLHVYIQEIESKELFEGDVTLTVYREGLFSDDEIIYGPMTVEIEENVYKFYPEFDWEANYLVRIQYAAEDAPWTIDLPMVVGNPGSPWKLLSAGIAGVILFLVVIRAVRIKRTRARRHELRELSLT